MTRVTLPQSARAQDVQRWLPPEVGVGLAALKAAEPESPSEDEIAEIKERARLAGAEAGFREGYKAGYREGRAKAAEEAEQERLEREARDAEHRALQDRTLTETVAALESVAAALSDPLADAVDELEPELLAMVEAVARRVVMHELESRPELIQGVLHEALKQLPSRHHAVRAHVHPDQQAILEAYAQAQGERISWIADPAIESGGCMIESGPSRIDATLEARLRQGVDAIWGEVARPPEAPDADLAPVGAPDDGSRGAVDAPAPLAPTVGPDDAPDARDGEIPDSASGSVLEDPE